MAEIVLRVRLIGGEHLDVTYEENGGLGSAREVAGAPQSPRGRRTS